MKFCLNFHAEIGVEESKVETNGRIKGGKGGKGGEGKGNDGGKGGKGHANGGD